MLEIGLTVSFWVCSKPRESQIWKSGQIPIGNDKAVAGGCKDAAGIAKAQFKLKLARNVKNSKKWFFRHTESKWKQKENIGPLLYGRGELVTNNAEKAEVLDTSFTSVLTNTVGLQALGTKFQVDANRLTITDGRVASKLLQELNATDPWALTLPTQGCEECGLMLLQGFNNL